MKKSLVSILLVLISIVSFAQNVNDQIEVLRDMAATERRALVAENMMLNEEESKIFWPLYDDYRAKARKLGTKEIAMIVKFADNYEKMTDETTTEIMNDYFSVVTAQSKLKATHRNKMVKVLSPKLVLRYMQIENKIDAIIDYSLAAEIPLTLKDVEPEPAMDVAPTE